MLKFVFIVALSLSCSAFAQEEYQETDYGSGEAEQEIDRGVASDGAEAIEAAPVPEESDPGYDYTAE